MSNGWRRTLALCCAVFVLLTVFARAGTARTRTIVGFDPLDKASPLSFPRSDKPPLDELTALFPKTLRAYLDGEETPVLLEVEWRCAAGEYENPDCYYFQFSPVWDETRFCLREGTDRLRDAPYISVFLTEEDGAALMEGGQTNEQRVFAYLTQSMGLNAAAACGVMANVYAESGFIPTNLQNSFESKLGYTDASYTAAVDDGSYTNFVRDGAGYGLCQWTYYSRKQALLNFARGRGESVGDLTMQLDFMRGEMASSLVRYLNGVENSADGAYQAAAYFCREFEKPSDTENAAKVRGNLAVNTFWPRYAGADLPAYIGRVTASPSLSINDRPAASSEGLSVRLGLIPKGETCIVYPDRSEGIWRWVEYKGIHGYAHGGYIEYVRAAVTGAAAVAELGFDGGDCLAWITDAPDGARALLAGYDAYGRMLALETEELSGGGICRFTVPAGVRRVRVFVVDADCAPLCAAAEARR